MTPVFIAYFNNPKYNYYLHNLHSDSYPHLCCYHNIPAIVPSNLHRVYIDVGNLQGIQGFSSEFPVGPRFIYT